MIIQSIINIAEICAQKGIEKVVLSPGSRCAHLAIAFVRHPKIETISITDERSAAFIALGMAQQSQKPVALLCTSGTAALNYYPAIAEAFYQNIPLVVFTADRPDEWIDQQDGQTIRQQNVYANHILKSYHLPVDYSHPDADWYGVRSVNEGINLCLYPTPGPVHFNVPIREPFYPLPGETIAFDDTIKIIRSYPAPQTLGKAALELISGVFQKYDKIVLLGGQLAPNNVLLENIVKFSDKYHLPILGDILSNINDKNKISHLDITLFDKSKHRDLAPEAIISFGKSVLSKNIKNFLRKNKPKCHIHLQDNAFIADYTQSITDIFHISDIDFFTQANALTLKSKDPSYLKSWKGTQIGFEEKLKNHFRKSEFSEFEAIFEIVKNLPSNTILHLANSMSVRYANYLQIPEGVDVYCNRGTSGIDGSSSTAVGAAMSSDRPVTLITGDLAFFYDRNAFWNNHLPANLQIYLLNNHAGGIFRIIDGPNALPELETYFETSQTLNAQNTASDFNMEYLKINNKDELKNILKSNVKNIKKPYLIEILSNSSTNTLILKSFSSKYKLEN